MKNIFSRLNVMIIISTGSNSTIYPIFHLLPFYSEGIVNTETYNCMIYQIEWLIFRFTINKTI